MPVLTIRHKTEYCYAKPVSFGEHRVMLRPRDGHDLRVLDLRMTIDPEPISLRWIHDVFGNSVGIAKFEGQSDRLVFQSEATIEHDPKHGIDLPHDDEAFHYPFEYEPKEMPDLGGRSAANTPIATARSRPGRASSSTSERRPRPATC